MKLCKDCYWVERSLRGKVETFAKCLNPGVRDDPKPDLVVGGMEKEYAPSAGAARCGGQPCGPDAKLFRSLPGEGRT